MKKVALAFAIALAGIFISCSNPTQHEDGTLWGTGTYEGIIACPITFLKIDFTKGSVELGRDEFGKPALKGPVLEGKSTLDTLWASVSDQKGYSYFVRFAIDYKNSHGVRGRWVPFDEGYIDNYGSPEFALVNIK